MTEAGAAPSVVAGLRRDLARYREASRRRPVPPSRIRVAVESLLFKAGFQAVLLYRLSHRAHRAGWTWLAWFIMRVNLAVTGAEIEFSARIGPGLLIAHPGGIVIGRGTVIGDDATIYQRVTCGIRSAAAGRPRAYPTIGDRVVLYAGATLVGGIRVGDRAVVGAHSLVMSDMPDDSRADAPAAAIRERGVQAGERVAAFEPRRRARA
jgi:serine O-acetyltransferase